MSGDKNDFLGAFKYTFETIRDTPWKPQTCWVSPERFNSSTWKSMYWMHHDGYDRPNYKCDKCWSRFYLDLKEGQCFITCPNCQHCWIDYSLTRDGELNAE